MVSRGNNEPPQPAAPRALPERTDLERRVLAHERILQSLIAYMSRTEPRFLDHLSKTFVDPLAMVQHEQDYTDSADYAGEFIRAVTALNTAHELRRRPMLGPLHPRINGRNDATRVPSHLPQKDRVQVCERNGIWAVTVDGAFHGDYHAREHAEAAAAVARLGTA
ncbi:hypothetical protein HUK65_16820 [Rhodobacteraceae bacterium 2376]|uniref:Uncharacterized protein n=1 Tax=Rhabdonatronobacter sediminivivens TaxID=2743469 RepID=A0A7Z0L2U8_9RHOB|nr:hypothetical protein [Rhabdonatronobacter sediminivivens]NYS26648.1 hypothetical protein [Rhabdonatronobacter sediminivivens]